MLAEVIAANSEYAGNFGDYFPESLKVVERRPYRMKNAPLVFAEELSMSSIEMD